MLHAIVGFNDDAGSSKLAEVLIKTTLNQSNSVDAEERATELLVWPNPATDAIHFSTELPSSLIRRIALFDAQGKQMYELLNASSSTIDVSSFPKGSYTLIFDAKDALISRQVLIE